MIPTLAPPVPGEWYRHRENPDICVTVIRSVPSGVMVRNAYRVETIPLADWRRSFYLSAGAA